MAVAKKRKPSGSPKYNRPNRYGSPQVKTLAQRVGKAVVHSQAVLERGKQPTETIQEHGQIEPARAEHHEAIQAEDQRANKIPTVAAVSLEKSGRPAMNSG